MPPTSTKPIIHFSLNGVDTPCGYDKNTVYRVEEKFTNLPYHATCTNCQRELEKGKFGIGGTADLSGTKDHRYAEGYAKAYDEIKGGKDVSHPEFLGGTVDQVYGKGKLGIKHDQDKLRYDLMSPVSNEGTAKVLTYGAKKYRDRNWENGIAYSRLYRAALGHLQDFWRRNDIDSESNLHHLDHAAANIHMLQHLSIVGPKMDDRPKYHNTRNTESATPAPLIHMLYGSERKVVCNPHTTGIHDTLTFNPKDVTCPECNKFISEFSKL